MSYTRVTRRTIRHAAGNRGLYELELELSKHGLSSAGGGGAPLPEVFPHVPATDCDTGDYFTNDLAFGKSVTLNPDNRTGTGSGGSLPTTTVTDHNAGSGLIAACCAGYLGGPRWDQYDIDLGSAQAVGEAQVWNPAPDPNNTGNGGLEGLEVWASDDGSSFHQVAAVADWAYRGNIWEPIPGQFADCWGVTIPSADRTHRYWGFRWKQNFISGFWGGYQFAGLRLIECVGGSDPEPPSPGQRVGPETVVMSGADGTTAWPFAAGSLRVTVNGIDQTAAIIAQDNAAGTFTLGFTRVPGEVVTVEYLGI